MGLAEVGVKGIGLGANKQGESGKSIGGKKQGQPEQGW